MKNTSICILGLVIVITACFCHSGERRVESEEAKKKREYYKKRPEKIPDYTDEIDINKISSVFSNDFTSKVRKALSTYEKQEYNMTIPLLKEAISLLDERRASLTAKLSKLAKQDKKVSQKLDKEFYLLHLNSAILVEGIGDCYFYLKNTEKMKSSYHIAIQFIMMYVSMVEPDKTSKRYRFLIKYREKLKSKYLALKDK